MMLDPQKYGGVLVRANSAHGDAANAMCISDSDLFITHLPMLVATKDAPVGQEVLWDYNAVTNKADDILLKEVCMCGGKDVTYHINGMAFKFRGCNGHYMRYVPK